MSLLQLLFLLLGGHSAATWIVAAWRGLRANHRRHLKPRPQRRQDWPSVSVIIPAWKEHGTLERCIASLRSVDYPDWEVVIVAGGPDETYRTAVEACQGLAHCTVIMQRPRGKNAALNDGLHVSRGEVLVLLDADSIVTPGWLRALIEPISDRIQATTGNPVPLCQTAISRVGQMEHISACEIHESVTLQGSGSIAIRRDVIEQIGRFPEDVPVGVDWDLDARLGARGVMRAYCPRAIVYTERPATMAQYWRNEVRWRRAHLAALIRLRTQILHNIPSTLASLYLYSLAWFFVLSTGGAIAVALFGPASAGIIGLSLWAAFVTWLALRRAALVIEVTAYTGQVRWCRDVWAPPALLFMTLLASCVASLSQRRVSVNFKGPRNAEGIRTSMTDEHSSLGGVS